MNLYPQDLCERIYARVVQRRYPNLIPTATEWTPHLGRLGKIWARVLPITPKQAAIVMPLTVSQNVWAFQFFWITMAGLVVFIIALFGEYGWEAGCEAMALITGVIAYLSLVTSPRAGWKKVFRRPLLVSEIKSLTPRDTTGLKSSYLDLVCHAIVQPVPEEAEDDVRAAVVSIGEAMDALPVIDPVQTDTGLLRGEAAALRAQARAEADTVIADSLRYQADAVLRRADAADRSAQYARRIAALRREIAAQIAAVQVDLSTFSSTGGAAVDRLALSHLAEGARRVATIAVSAANARAELDGFSAPLIRQTSFAADELPVQNLQRTIK